MPCLGCRGIFGFSVLLVKTQHPARSVTTSAAGSRRERPPALASYFCSRSGAGALGGKPGARSEPEKEAPEEEEEEESTRSFHQDEERFSGFSRFSPATFDSPRGCSVSLLGGRASISQLLGSLLSSPCPFFASTCLLLIRALAAGLPSSGGSGSVTSDFSFRVLGPGFRQSTSHRFPTS